MRHYGVQSAHLTLALALLALSQGASGDIFMRDTWPGEGTPVLVAGSDTLTLHSNPSLESPIRQIAYQAGWRIPFIRSVMHTLKSSEVRVVQDATLEIICDGVVDDHRFTTGDTLEYLQYRAEGYVTARVAGRICEVPLLIHEEVFDDKYEGPVVEWWVQVKYGDGSSPGWLLIDESQVDFGGREF